MNRSLSSCHCKSECRTKYLQSHRQDHFSTYRSNYEYTILKFIPANCHTTHSVNICEQASCFIVNQYSERDENRSTTSTRWRDLYFLGIPNGLSFRTMNNKYFFHKKFFKVLTWSRKSTGQPPKQIQIARKTTFGTNADITFWNSFSVKTFHRINVLQQTITFCCPVLLTTSSLLLQTNHKYLRLSKFISKKKLFVGADANL